VWNYLYNKLIRPIFTINDTPHSIALGVAFGMFVALTPTVGLQILTIAVIGTLIKANRIIGFILCWISNPITLIPMYYGYYWLGGKVLNIQLLTFGTFSDKIDRIVETTEKFGYLVLFKQLGYEFALPLWVGSLIIAFVVSAPLYPITRYALRRHRQKHESSHPDVNAMGSNGGTPALCHENGVEPVQTRMSQEENLDLLSSSHQNRNLRPVKEDK
jgi:uncharacterized protein (DUF2062 family)